MGAGETALGKAINAERKAKGVKILHTHIGGAVPLAELWRLGSKRGIRGVGTQRRFIDRMHLRASNTGDLDSYLSVFDLSERIQAGPESIFNCTLAAIAHEDRFAGVVQQTFGEQQDRVFNIVAQELRLNPIKRTAAHLVGTHYQGQYDVDAIFSSLNAAVLKSQVDFGGGLAVGLICTFARDLPYEINLILANKIAKWREKIDTIVGIDLAGPESVQSFENPKELAQLKECFDIAAGKDLGRTVHLGETKHTTIKIFATMIETLNPHRVAHPIAAVKAWLNEKNDRGMKLLQERRIVCEICPYSNRLTGALNTPEEFKTFFGALDDFCVEYTFGPDSPALQNSTLAWELEWLVSNNALSADQLERAFASADRATFIKEEKR
ncbi:MAG: hypothetical protein U0136_04775 [Bdellovibrionota bacterium]